MLCSEDQPLLVKMFTVWSYKTTFVVRVERDGPNGFLTDCLNKTKSLCFGKSIEAMSEFLKPGKYARLARIVDIFRLVHCLLKVLSVE